MDAYKFKAKSKVLSVLRLIIPIVFVLTMLYKYPPPLLPHYKPCCESISGPQQYISSFNPPLIVDAAIGEVLHIDLEIYERVIFISFPVRGWFKL